MARNSRVIIPLLIMGLWSVISIDRLSGSERDQQQTLDPAAWGDDHVGKRLPDYVQGDECLFCHRNDIGPGWQKNPHRLSIRSAEEAADVIEAARAQSWLASAAAQSSNVLGGKGHFRLLRRDGYGRFAIHSGRLFKRSDGTVSVQADGESDWDREKFANRCAGCHTTAVDPKSKTFAASVSIAIHVTATLT